MCSALGCSGSAWAAKHAPAWDTVCGRVPDTCHDDLHRPGSKAARPAWRTEGRPAMHFGPIASLVALPGRLCSTSGCHDPAAVHYPHTSHGSLPHPPRASLAPLGLLASRLSDAEGAAMAGAMPPLDPKIIQVRGHRMGMSLSATMSSRLLPRSVNCVAYSSIMLPAEPPPPQIIAHHDAASRTPAQIIARRCNDVIASTLCVVANCWRLLTTAALPTCHRFTRAWGRS